MNREELSEPHDHNHSVEAVARRLGVSVYTVRSWLRQGRLEHFKFGRRVLVTETEVLRFIDAGRIPAREAR